jgi:BolA family transcriptional regulator, general stress-responsive regulator
LLLSFSIGALYSPISKQLFQSQIFFMLYSNKLFMNINELIVIVKSKIEAEIVIQNFKIEDKSFLHKNHKGNQEGMFHLKLIIKSEELKRLSKIESTKKIYNILDVELKEHIHSIQILIS